MAIHTLILGQGGTTNMPLKSLMKSYSDHLKQYIYHSNEMYDTP